MDKKERLKRYNYLMGLSAWEIGSYKDEQVFIVNDGPSGLRRPKESFSFSDQSNIIKTVCLPTPSALASTFDRDLCYKNGEILARECAFNGTHVLLAPGVNIKRYPLCGRNFEYFSEDPLLAGILSSEYIKGLQDNGVGACIKHYVANNQEHARFINSSEMSLRALNEIYLRVFNIAIRESSPWCLMTSYNRVNGEYVNESEYLINKKLRGEYNYQGLIMSDWCAVNNRGLTIKNGLNIEMPLSKRSGERLENDLNEGIFTEEDLINIDNKTCEVIKGVKEKFKFLECDLDLLHEEAVKIANNSLILAKNHKNYLPINKQDKVLILGYFASHNRFVGEGSGWVNAYKCSTFIDVLNENNINYEFIECYDENDIKISIDELTTYRNKFDKVILFMGQYQKDESEGYDRSTIDFRKHQLDLLTMVKEVFTDFAVVVISGSVMNIKPIYENSNSLLITYLAGEGQNEAIFNNLFGIHNPCGRLPETWISSFDQNPIINEYLRRDIYHTYYYDDIYVGYRYYDKKDIGFLLPFGYGLSYSSFEYDSFKVSLSDNKILVSLNVKNTSLIDGDDVIQIYIGKKDSNIYRPIKELKGFGKVHVAANESNNIEILINIDDLSSYRNESDKLEIENGKYEIYVCKNVNEILYKDEIYIEGVEFEVNKESIKLVKKDIPNAFSINSPIGLIYKNELVRDFMISKGIDYDKFEKYCYKNYQPLRDITYNFNVDFEDIDNLVCLLNASKEKICDIINFDNE